ncbi:MAG: AAA family ATPase [Candidatus Babeliaceae bacterium]|jgi:cell division protease FtsH
MKIKQKNVYLLATLLSISSYSYSMMFAKKIMGLSATTTAIAAGYCTWSNINYAKRARAEQMPDNHSKTKWVRPDWALKNNLPNGVPQEIADLVDFLKNPKKYTDLGADMPKGLLLYGPSGTGKTTIARAITQAAGYGFIAIAGSDLMARYQGESAALIESIFNEARSVKKAVIFIDEIEVAARKRAGEKASGTDEQVTQLLKELDGFHKDSSIFLIAATNIREAIDPALLRPGRLDYHVLIPLPDNAGREDIIKHYLTTKVYKGKNISSILAAQTEGCSGADLKFLINNAAIIAARENAKAVTEKHLLASLEAYKNKKSEL